MTSRNELLDKAFDLTSTALEPWLARWRRERTTPACEIERLLAVEPTLDAAHLRESTTR